mgnify:CR=1 FL=1
MRRPVIGIAPRPPNSVSNQHFVITSPSAADEEVLGQNMRKNLSYVIMNIMDRYDPLKIEQKWQKIWAETKAFAAGPLDETKPKKYLAEMFPYPSGAGLHVGHVRNFTIVDVLARFYTQQEINVLRPFGYDTFGLPAENYAIKTGISPQSATATNIANFRKQAQKLGYAIDWDREINTSDPEYYKWTQWCFLQLYKAGLAYQKESYQWWCPVDKTVLANEQVENGHCWRCGHEVEKKKMKQWFFKITDYADELLEDIDQLDWPEKIKTMQKNWIGRSEGATVKFAVKISGKGTEPAISMSSGGSAEVKRDDPATAGAGDAGREKAAQFPFIEVFTTRPDTIFGATFLVLAPEHPLVKSLVNDNTREKVEEYCKNAIKKSEIERQENKEKTGVFTGSYAINPATGKEIPIWVADYVLMGYGTGAIMAVPFGDERDFEFAEKFDLPVIQIIEAPDDSPEHSRFYQGEGVMVNSAQFNGTRSEDAREQIVAWLEQIGVGQRKVTYKMRDWLISRQRYWGCPIPVAYDKDGNVHPIPEDQLPVIHPEVKDYQPDDSGRSPLAKAEDWLKVTLKDENGEEIECTRETDTLDGYACSSWYLWRYVSPHDKKAAWDQEAIKYWAPTDVYVGGDHAVAHLLYVRFWCKFFADQGYLPFREPVKKLLYNGYINAPDGKKMSKSKGNVIDPLEVIDSGYGADTLRTYEMFIGPYDQDAAWNTEAIGGVYRFLNRCWTLGFGEFKDSGNEVIRNKMIKKVTEDIHRNSFNTAVAALMEYVNELYKAGATKEDVIALAKMLKPFAPHLASEILEHLESDDIWPRWDEKYLTEDEVEVVVQVNGKLRAKLMISTDFLGDEEKLKELALADANVQKFIAGKEIRKVIVPRGAKLINIVV